jgi:hypothetical protein
MGLQARKGTRTPVQFSATASPPRYVATAGQPLIAIQAAAYGDGVAGGQVYPAFGLSGDYLVQGEWDMNGAHYVCTQKVKVAAPGIRAELCWDTVGGEEQTNPAGNDLDLHLARLQGLTCPKKGWDITCQDQQSGNILGDCYWNGITGCRDFSASPPGWGYADSPQASCTGWSSKRKPVDGVNFKQSCTNPRLDRDLVSCDKTIDDPTINTGVAGAAHVFCGPENVNLDNPNDGDKFLIGVNHFNNYLGPSGAHPHVNLYCNGERALSVGYDPVAGQTSFPLLNVPGQDTKGDVWTVGLIITHVSGGQVTSCSVITVPSHHADQTRDGVTNPTTSGNEFCVDSTMSNANPPFNYKTHAFVENLMLQPPPPGSIPMTTAGYCKH